MRSLLFLLLLLSTPAYATMDTLILDPVLDTICADEPLITAREEGITYAWSTGQSTRQIQAPASGTYVATITDANGDVLIDPHEVTVITVPNPVLPVADREGPFCEGDEIIFSVDLTGYDSLQWNDGRGTIIPGFGPGNRMATYTFAVGRGVSYIAFYDRCRERLTVLPPLLFSEDDLADEFSGGLLPPDPETVCPDDTVALSFAGENFERLNWEDGSTDPDRLVVADPTVDYALTVYPFCGDSIVFPTDLAYRTDCNPVVETDCEVGIPELITPNGDGTNESFRLFTNCPVTDYQLRVFNRWGQVVFESQNPEQGWDGSAGGTAQATDTYLYAMSYRLADEAPAIREGQFTLIR